MKKVCECDFSSTSIYSMKLSCPVCKTCILDFHSGVNYILCPDCKAKLNVKQEKSKKYYILELFKNSD